MSCGKLGHNIHTFENIYLQKKNIIIPRKRSKSIIQKHEISTTME